MRILFTLLFISLIDCVTFASKVEVPEYHVQNFTADNGLPQNSVKGIAQDKNGFIWLATENGVVRFGGNNFYTFDNMSLPIGMNRFTSFQPNLKLGEGKGSASEHDLYCITGKNEYVRISNSTCQVEVEENIFRNYPYLPAPAEEKGVVLTMGLPNRFRETFFAGKYLIPDNRGGLYVRTIDSVAYFLGKDRQYTIKYKSNGFWTFFRIGNELVSNEEDGTFLKLGKGGTTRLILTGDILGNSHYSPGRADYEVFFNNSNGSSFLYLGQSLYKLSLSDGTLSTKLILEDFDFTQNYIACVLYDEAKQSLFLGSLTKGLFVFSTRQFRVRINPTLGSDNVFYSQTLLSDGSVLTPQGEVFGLNEHRYLKEIGNDSDWDRYSILTDTQGYIWKKKGSYLLKYDPSGRRELNKWFLNGEITQLTLGLSGDIYIATRKMGLFVIDSQNSQAEPHLFYKGNLREISYVQNENSRLLWIGTDNGLYCLDLITKKIVTEVAGLKGVYIRSFYVTKPGEVWITTSSKGFFLWKDNKLVSFPKDPDGYLKDAHCIVEDTNGFFWIPTNKGLFQVAKKDLYSYVANPLRKPYYLYYNKDDGFNTNEFNGGCTPCALKLPNGYISLPSMDGLVWFDPLKMKPQLPDKELFVDNVVLDGAAMQNKDTLELPRSFGQLSFHLTTPYFGSNKNIHFYYALLKGKTDTTWIKLTDSNHAIFISNLKYGSYQLVLRKTNGFGIDNYSQKIITLIIQPAYYETNWFFAFVALLVAFIIYGLIKIRTQYLLVKNSKLELRVTERTNELQQTLKALRLSENNLSWQTYIQERIIAAISHDIRTPLRYLGDANQELYKYIAEISSDDAILEISKSAYESALRMHHQTNNLLEYIKPQLRKLGQSPFEDVDLYSVVEEKMRIFEDIAKANSTTILNEVRKNFVVLGIRQLCSIVIHNLLDNAVKMTFSGTISIKSEMLGDKAYLIIEDTADGMPEELAEWLSSDDFYLSGSERAVPPQKSGIGLIIVKEMANLLHINVRVETEESKGTKVYLIFDKLKLERKTSEVDRL